MRYSIALKFSSPLHLTAIRCFLIDTISFLSGSELIPSNLFVLCIMRHIQSNTVASVAKQCK